MDRKNDRKHPGVRGRRPDRKEARRIGAQARAEVRADRTRSDIVADLDRRLGKGLGAKRERSALARGR